MRRYINPLRDMSVPAYTMLRCGVLLALGMNVAGLMILVASEQSCGLVAYFQMRTAAELYSAAAKSLLMSVVLSFLLECRGR